MDTSVLRPWSGALGAPRRRPMRLGALLGTVVLSLALGWGTAANTTPAAAQQAVSSDLVRVARLSATAAAAPRGAIRLEATVDYRLQTVPRGRLLFFIFEDD